ncbi:MAG: T9SS type A sorting domain-containing protein [Bacteroidales bacterium]|nr:T9SS type A sorting domain-containing protein [Bacteroidales bacterium]
MKNYFYTAVLSLLLPIMALSQWSTNPAVTNPINTMTGEQAIPKIATCPDGDSYIASFSSENGNYNVRMQRLDAQGNTLWATNGILISDNPQMTWLTDWDMTADGSNHAILTFQDIRNGGNNNVVAYRIAPDGSFIWGPDGIALSNSTAFNVSPKVTVTSSGNAVFAWQADEVIIMQKVSPSGTLLWGSGIILSGTPTFSWPQLMPVGSDDVILKYFEDTGPSYSPTRHVFARRYNSSGSPVWSSPAAISTAGGISAWTQIFPFINDGSDGFYIAWHDDRDNNMLASAYVQHISNSGAVLFQANGVEASTLSGRNHYYPQLALPPGSSNVFVFWNEMDGDQNLRGIYGQKLTSTGSRLWATTGMVFIEISSTNVYPYAARNSPTDVVLFYDEYFDAVNSQLKAMRVDADGGYVWTPSFKTICSVNSEKVHTEVNDFADNQWILSWEDNRSGDRDIYAQNIQLNGDLGPWDPQEGTIEGMVTLVGGTASVTLVSVEAGEIVTNPDTTGFYSMVVPSGTYEVIGSLARYESDTVPGVVVVTDQTTDDVNLTLVALPTGFITGTVILTEGNGDVTEVEVTAGYHTVNPDASGNYTMEIEIGTYDVTAALAGYVAETDTGIVVVEGMTTVGVDFELSLVPTTGFIEGMVLLQNGTGDVTQVDVTAGTVTVNPDTTGHYIMEITAGTWEVTASLTGFLTGVVPGVVVQVEQTTPDVDFFLYQAPDVGYIEGFVTLLNGSGDVTEATVAAGGQTNHPSSNGYYFLALPEGTYTVVASHPYTLPDSITNVAVVTGATTGDVDLELEILRGDLVSKAVDDFNNPLNNVDVEITGPEGIYTGTITNDSLIFEDLPYGLYNGTAWLEGFEPVYANDEMDETDHDIVFYFYTTGIIEGKAKPDEFMVVSPNPFFGSTFITLQLNDPSAVSLKIYSQQGQLITTLAEGKMDAGIHHMAWSGKSESGQVVAPGMYTIVLQTSLGRLSKVLIKQF